MNSLNGLRIKIFADGADRATMLDLYRNPLIKGFTTNPTMMRSAGVSGYEEFARGVLADIPDRPISFEVFSDDEGEMGRQARTIAGWGANVYVKIPVTNTLGKSTAGLVHRLAADSIKVNVTALMTLAQVSEMGDVLRGPVPACVSVFAGRIADTGVDPVPIMAEAVRILADSPNIELIWASPREVLNIFHAESAGCHIITATHDLLKKLHLVGKDLGEYSLETVKMFYRDAAAANLAL
ncbi:MAG TPA: transaldolase [Candidatus Rubrimentiphilum sp.]|nr:transaldolase [Candidatus Rubrimentiphilum sp.]